MDYCAETPLLNPAKQTCRCRLTEIAHMTAGMLMAASCTVLIIMPIIFTTIFILGTFHTGGAAVKLHPSPSVLLSKIQHPSESTENQLVSSKSSMPQSPSIPITISIYTGNKIEQEYPPKTMNRIGKTYISR